MTRMRNSLGAWGEAIALRYLLKKGDLLLARNVRTKFGELDLITRRGQTIVFTEVKTRRTGSFGLPETAITATKQQHLIESALAYLVRHPEHDGDWQIDVIAIRTASGLQPEILLFENAVTG